MLTGIRQFILFLSLSLSFQLSLCRSQEYYCLQYIIDSRVIWYVCYVIPTLNGLTPLNHCKFSPLVIKIPYKVYDFNKTETHNAHLFCFVTVLKTNKFSCTNASRRRNTFFLGTAFNSQCIYLNFFGREWNKIINPPFFTITITLVPVNA